MNQHKISTNELQEGERIRDRAKWSIIHVTAVPGREEKEKGRKKKKR